MTRKTTGKIVYLTSGPRGSGKTNYAYRIKSTNPDLIVIEYDKIILDNFGKEGFNPYLDLSVVAKEFALEKIQELISKAPPNSRIILDAWNGCSVERDSYVKLLRKLEVEMIICLYFTISVKTCIKWFRQKLGCSSTTIKEIAWEHRLYYRQSTDIKFPEYEVYFPEQGPTKADGFDAICRINPETCTTLPCVTLDLSQTG